MTLSGVAGFDRRQMVVTGLRSGMMAVALVALYYLVPVEHHPHQSIVLRLTVALVVFVIVLGNEVRSVVNHSHPMLRAAVSMATVIPLFLILFAWIYLSMSHSNPAFFSRPLDRTTALYFTMTVFSTVGFGDIVPKIDPARIVTMIQMGADLVLIAVVVRLILGAASTAQTQARQG